MFQMLHKQAGKFSGVSQHIDYHVHTHRANLIENCSQTILTIPTRVVFHRCQSAYRAMPVGVTVCEVNNERDRERQRQRQRQIERERDRVR